jgi:predicted O-methyltransferase YrrM
MRPALPELDLKVRQRFDLPREYAKQIGDEERLQHERFPTTYWNFYWSLGNHFKPASILEIGCRYGNTAMSLMIGSGASRYVGMDIDPERIETCRAVLKEALPKETVIRFIHGDIREGLPETLERFEMIHCDSFHRDVTYELRASMNHLEEGGVIVVDDCSHEMVWEPCIPFLKERGFKLWYVPSMTGQIIGIRVDKEPYTRGSQEWQDFSELLPRLDLDDRSSWSGPIEKNPLEHLERALRRKIT